MVEENYRREDSRVSVEVSRTYDFRGDYSEKIKVAGNTYEPGRNQDIDKRVESIRHSIDKVQIKTLEGKTIKITTR